MKALLMEEKGKPSDTAEVMAILRAYHLKKESPVLFEDPFALKLVRPLRRFFFALPFVPGMWGVSARALSMDPQKERTIFLPEGTGREFDAGDMSFGLSYAQYLTDKFSAGGTVHFIHSGLAEKSVNTYAIDFGLIYRIGIRGMRLGMMIQSLGGKVNYDNREAKMPTLFKVSLAVAAYQRGAHSMDAVGEFSHPSDNTEHLNIGGEYSFNQFFYYFIC